MHSLVIVAAILFAGIGGFVVGVRASVAMVRRMNDSLRDACKVMDAQSELILSLLSQINPDTAAELRGKWEITRA